MSDLYRRYSPVISQAVTMCVRLPSCPGHSRVRQGWRRRFRVTQAKRERKPNEIRLLQFPEILPIRKFVSREREIFFGTQENRVPLTSLILLSLRTGYYLTLLSR